MAEEVKKSPKQLKAEAKAAKAATKHAQKINSKIVKLENKKKEIENSIKTTSNPKKRAELRTKLDSVEDKLEKLKDPNKNRSAKLVLQTWSKGLSKEASRITWEKKRDVLKDFITIVVVCVILAIIFFALDMIIITIRK